MIANIEYKMGGKDQEKCFKLNGKNRNKGLIINEYHQYNKRIKKGRIALYYKKAKNTLKKHGNKLFACTAIFSKMSKDISFNLIAICWKQIISIKFKMTQSEDSFLKCKISQQSPTIYLRKPQKEPTLKGCEKGNFDLAVENIKKISNRYNGEQQVSLNVDVDYFKKYGTGIYLFFQLTKRLAILFTLFAIISIIPMALNIKYGIAFQSIIRSFGTYFGETTVGNLTKSPMGQTSLSKEDSAQYKIHNAIPDLIISFIFLIFYIYWQVKSHKISEEIKEQVKFQCYYALEVNKFPSGTTQNDIKQFFSQFGKIAQISTVQNYSELIDLSKDIFELEQKKKEIILQLESTEDILDKQSLQRRIQQCNEKVSQIENNFIMTSKEAAGQVLKYIVVFQDTSARQNAIVSMKSYQKCCKWGISHIPPQHLLKGEKINVEPCHNEPANIIWENQHVPWQSKFIRIFIQLILLIIIIAATFLFISVLNIAAPSTSTNLNVGMYDAKTIMNVTNSTILYVWCVTNKDLMNSNAHVKSLCTSYITQYYVSFVIGILISCFVVGVKFVVKKIVIALSKFQRYKSHTDQSIGIMRNLLYTYICTTALTTFLLQANIFGFSFKEIILGFVSNTYLRDNSAILHEFSDFVPFWYSEIGYKINLSIMIMSIQAPLVPMSVQFVKDKFRRWRAQRQVTQKSMEDIMTPDAFDIQDHYANVLLIMFMSCAFSSGMPLIMIPCALALVLRYFYFKMVFVRYNHIPNSIDEALNENVVTFFPYILLFHFLFGIWMYSSNSIFVQNESFVSDLLNSKSPSTKNVGFLLRRLGDTSYFTISLMVCVAVVILKIIFYDIVYEVYKTRINDKIFPFEDKASNTETQQIRIEPKNEELVQSKSLTNSYKIENNPKYFQILVIMNRLKKNRQVQIF